MRDYARTLATLLVLLMAVPALAVSPPPPLRLLHDESAAQSIWPRLVGGMRLGDEERPEVRRFIAHYRSNPAFFSLMLSRAEPFLWFILEEVEKRGLPSELALLPAVESSWNPHAVSVSSAYGLWQFIPETGKAYGLRDALNYDARRDPVASTSAAMQLLEELYAEYRSWPLALAAYNTGGVRLKQAMKAQRSRHFWQLPLPSVTKDYVPRLLAIAALVREPTLHGITLPHISAQPAAELVALDHRAALPGALIAARVDPAVLRTFNPGLTDADAPTHSPTLLLPRGDALALRAELAALQSQAVTGTVSQLSGIEHLPTESLQNAAAVAAATAATAPARRFASQLHWAGHLSGGRAAPSPSVHRVRRGDTLFAIARLHRIEVTRLLQLNPAAKGLPLQVDQLIYLVGCSRPTCG